MKSRKQGSKTSFDYFLRQTEDNCFSTEIAATVMPPGL